MLDYRAYIETVIMRHDYILSDIEDRINKLWVDAKLTDTERDELMALAAENVDEALQIDVLERLADLDARVAALEHPETDYPTWQPGMVVKKMEIVKYEVTGDGVLDLCLFDGGNAQTSLKVGRINGWYLLDAQLERTHEIHLNDDGTYTLTPVNE